MGIHFYDNITWGHFIGGVFYRIVVYPKSPILSFIISITIHLFTEIIEKKVHPVTGDKEKYINRVGDIVFFIIGWLYGSLVERYVPPYRYPLYHNLRYYILVIVAGISLHEIMREFIFKTV